MQSLLNCLQNHFIQIGTGEGKSIIIAVTAIVLALLDFQVTCVCYSEYLSERDLNDFSDIIKEFEISKDIIY